MNCEIFVNHLIQSLGSISIVALDKARLQVATECHGEKHGSHYPPKLDLLGWQRECPFAFLSMVELLENDAICLLKNIHQ